MFLFYLQLIGSLDAQSKLKACRCFPSNLQVFVKASSRRLISGLSRQATVAAFWNFFRDSKSQFKVPKSKKSENVMGTFVISILKVDYLVAIFFQISYSLVLKIGICLKYFLDKNPKKQPLCRRFGCAHECAGIRLSLRQRRFEGYNQHSLKILRMSSLFYLEKFFEKCTV